MIVAGLLGLSLNVCGAELLGAQELDRKIPALSIDSQRMVPRGTLAEATAKGWCLASLRRDIYGGHVLHLFGYTETACGPQPLNLYCFARTDAFEFASEDGANVKCNQFLAFDGCTKF